MIKKLLLAWLLIWTVSGMQGQIIHADPWTGYIDDVSIHGMLIKDSMLYVSTWYGTARVSTTSGTFTFFHEIQNGELPVRVDFSVASIDDAGRLWSMEEDGIYYIDPLLYKVVVAPLPLHAVTTINHDREGSLWVGMAATNSSQALAKWSGAEWEYFDVGTTNHAVQDIAFDLENKPWLTGLGGIRRYNGSSFESVIHNGDPVLGLDELIISADGKVVTGRDSDFHQNANLWYFDKNTWHKISSPYGALPFFDDNNVLWYTNQEGSVFRVPDGNLPPETIMSPPVNYQYGEDTYTFDAGFDNLGQLWMGKSTGLFKATDVATDHWEFIPPSDLLPPSKSYDITAAVDSAWLLGDAGLFLFTDDHFTKLESIDKGITAIQYDYQRKGLWIGYPGKVEFRTAHDTIIININPLLLDSLSNNYMSDITVDSLGNIWFQVYRTGFLRYSSTGQWKRFRIGIELPTAPNGFGLMNVNRDALYTVRTGFDPPGPMLVVSRIIKIQGDSVTELDIEGSFITSGAFAMLNDSTAWFVNGDDFVLYEDGQVTYYDPGNHLNNEELHLYKDSTVFACSNFGLYIFSKGKWSHPEISHNLLSNGNALPCAFSADDKLYMSSSSLLVLEKIDSFLQELTDLHESESDNIVVRAFPNPVSDQLFLTTLKDCSDCNIQVFSATGLLMQSYQQPLPSSFDFADYPAGVYWMRIQNNKHNFTTLGIVKL